VVVWLNSSPVGLPAAGLFLFRPDRGLPDGGYEWMGATVTAQAL
jgi:hypothetical protein